MDRLLDVLGRQRGVFSRGQALGCGFTPHTLSLLVERNRWRPLLPGVYAAWDDSGWSTKARAALLWGGGGSALARRSTARLYELDGPWNEVEIVGASRTRSPEPWLKLLRCQVSPSDLTSHQGLRTTSVSRMLIDLGAVVDDDRVEIALESAIRKGLTSPDYLERRLAFVAARGRRGVATLRRVLAARSGGPPTESHLETRLVQLLRCHRVFPPERQFTIRDDDREVARVDLAWPQLKLAVEADGYRWHGGRRCWKRDMSRLSDIASVGWRTLHATADDIDQPAAFLAMVRRALGERQLSFGNDDHHRAPGAGR